MYFSYFKWISRHSLAEFELTGHIFSYIYKMFFSLILRKMLQISF